MAELAQISELAAGRHGVMLDIFGGSGFGSDWLVPVFRRIDLIDETASLLPASSTKRRVYEGDACWESGLRQLPGVYDLAVCLAGFHHILAEGAERDSPLAALDTEGVRLGVLRRWRALLRPGGRLILADVPQTGEVTSSENGRGRDGVADLPKLKATLGRAAEPTLEIPAFSMAPEPAEFLDEFVAPECPSGHTACFETANHVAQIMRKAGFKNVQTAVRMAPWRFPTLGDATWFLHELFGIGGESISEPLMLPCQKAGFVRDAIDRYLGSCETKAGTLIGWRLLYAWGDRPT